MYLTVFMTDMPDDYWCAIPDLHNNISEVDLKHFAIPYDSATGFDKCHRYKVNWTNLLFENTTWTSIEPNSSLPVEKCLNGWIFKGIDINASIVTQVL